MVPGTFRAAALSLAGAAVGAALWICLGRTIPFPPLLVAGAVLPGIGAGWGLRLSSGDPGTPLRLLGAGLSLAGIAAGGWTSSRSLPGALFCST